MNQELRELHAAWLRRNNEEGRNSVAGATEEREGREEGDVASEIPGEVKPPVAFTPQVLPATTIVGIPSPVLQVIETSSDLYDADHPPDAFADEQITTTSSPTLSISTISDSASTEFYEDSEEDSVECVPTRHGKFYLEDGNVEIVCEQTIFRVHSTVVSFSSPKLRGMLSSYFLLNAPMPEGCPRVVFNDGAKDFAVLLKMIYMPGWVFSPRRRSCKLTR